MSKKKVKYKVNYKKLAETLATTAGLLALLWVGISWVDIIADNTTTAQHASWNFFVLLTK